MRFLHGTTVIAAVVVLSGCSSSPTPPPTTAAIAARLSADPDAKLAKLSAPQVTCVAGVLRTYVRASDLTAYVAHTRAFADLDGTNAKAAQAAVVACVTPNP